jgi:D-glycero-D-manno-heptose 1,7-bisphosphate phosphatase
MTIAIFLDRDGTLIRDTGYISSPQDIRILEGVIIGLKLFIARGYELHVVSNQSGVPRKKITRSEFIDVESHISELFLQHEIAFDSLNYCFHLPWEGCKCRKPDVGLFETVSLEFNLNRNSSVMIGNSEVDRIAAENFGIAFWEVGVDKQSFLQVAWEVIDYFEKLN